MLAARVMCMTNTMLVSELAKLTETPVHGAGWASCGGKLVLLARSLC